MYGNGKPEVPNLPPKSEFLTGDRKGYLGAPLAIHSIKIMLDIVRIYGTFSSIMPEETEKSREGFEASGGAA